MDHMQIVKRAWKILWSYRALWIFGIILALTTASGFNGGSGGSGGRSSQGDGQDFHFPDPNSISPQLEQMKTGVEQFLMQYGSTLIAIGIALGILLLLFMLALTVGRYVSQAAQIRMVDGYEQSGEKVTWKQGFRLGWSRSAWRLFLINLTVYLPLVLGAVVLFGCAVLPTLLGPISGRDPSVPGIIATVGMAFLFIFVLIVVGIALSLVMEVIYRVCVLRNEGVFASIRTGWQLVRRNLKDVFLMWLLVIGINIAVMILTIPVALVVVGLGLVAGGGIGAALYFIIQAAASSTAGTITAGVVGGIIFLTILSVPLIFVRGLQETYLSTLWTLTYRELKLPLPNEAPVQPDEGAPLPA